MPRLEDLPPDLVAAAVSKAVVDAVAEGGEADAITRRALQNAKRALRLSDPPPAAPVQAPHHGSNFSAPSDPGPAVPTNEGPLPSGRVVVTEDDVIDAVRAGHDELGIPSGALVTPLARDTAKDRGVRLVEG